MGRVPCVHTADPCNKVEETLKAAIEVEIQMRKEADERAAKRVESRRFWADLATKVLIGLASAALGAVAAYWKATQP